MRAPTPADVEWMRRAIALSRRGTGQTHPNPLVGAVIVAEGRVVGEGHHTKFGAAHAEIEALKQAGERARGATLYVTMEPCSHDGKTPPCSRAIVDAGIRRVVFGVADPHPEAGGGADELAEQGIVVSGGVLAKQVAGLNAPFLWWHTRQVPYVALKLAVSLDGKIAEREGARTDLTGPEAGLEVMRLRAAHDAIMVGAGTVLADDPLLTVRGIPAPRMAPLRVVLDSSARTPPGSRLISSVDEGPVLLLVGPDADEGRISMLRGKGVEVQVIERFDGPALSIPAALDVLKDRGRTAILCEGGATVAASLLSGGHVQRLYWFVCPRLLGQGGVGAVADHRAGAGSWRLSDCTAVGEDAQIVWNHVELEAVVGES